MFFDEDDYEYVEEDKDKFDEKYNERLQRARRNILGLKVPYRYTTGAIKEIYSQALKSRLIKVMKDSVTPSHLRQAEASSDRDYYIVLMGRVSYKFLLGKTYTQLDGSTVSIADTQFTESDVDKWSKKYTVVIDEDTTTTITTSRFCQIFQRNVLPAASMGVPIGCECKDWEFRFADIAKHASESKLHNFATAGCKHMLAVEEVIREYPKTIDQNSQ